MQQSLLSAPRLPALANFVLLSCVLSTQPALAQDTATSYYETIVVTARAPYRGDFEPMETPQANQLITSFELERAGVTDMVSALDLSASVARQNNFGGLWNAFAVRGFAGDENLPSNYLVNGFNAGRGFAGPRDLAGVQAVEVLKGPRSALFGRGEPGGTVNLITKRPTFERAGSITASLSRYEAMRVDGDFDTPLGENAALRLVGFYEDAESFRDTIDTTRYGFFPSLALTFGDTTVNYEIEYTDQEIPFDRGVVSIDGDADAISRKTFLGEPGDGDMDAEVFGHQLEVEHEFNSDWSLLAGFTYRDTSLQGLSTEPELSGSRQLLLVDGETLTRQQRDRDYDADFTAVRAELAGAFDTGPWRHRVLIGADYDEFENDQVFLRYRAPPLSSDPTLEQLLAINVFDPVYGQYDRPDPTLLTDRKETQEAYGFYVQDQISLTETLHVRLGVRYDDFEQKLDNRINDTSSNQSDDRWSPQVGVVYQASPMISLYFAYGEGFRQLSGTDIDGNGFSPNTTESLELGVKVSLMDGRVQGTATYFSIDQDNMLVGDPVNPFFLVSIGEAESQGFELDLNGELYEGLSFMVSYTYVDAQWKDDLLDPNFNRTIEDGDPLINIPEHTFSAQLSQSLNLWSRPVMLGGGVLYVDDRLGETGTDFELPSYTTAQIFAEVEVTDALSVRGDMFNVFDEKYQTNSFSSLWIEPGAPRIWRLSASYSF